MNALDKDSRFLWPALNSDPTDQLEEGRPTFKAYFYKPQGRPAYVCSSRVLATGNSFISIINFQKKAGELTFYIQGAATAKKIGAAFIELHAALIAGGYIAADTPAPAGRR
jgi:hypothetical protein